MKILVFGAGAYGLILALFYLFQNGLLFLPNVAGRELSATPGDIGLEYTEVRFRTQDGETLHGWHVPATDAPYTLLFFHGNAGNISHRLESIRLFNRMGLNVLIVDYRGYGNSTGRPSEDGTYLDARAAWDFLTAETGVPSGQIILFGRSLGGAVAAWLAERVPAAALIMESTFTSVPDMGARLYPWLPVRLMAKLRYESINRMPGLKLPLLIIHSRDDEIIPFDQGLALYNAASHPKRLLAISGGHNGGFLVSGGTYVGGIMEFLSDNLPAPQHFRQAVEKP